MKRDVRTREARFFDFRGRGVENFNVVTKMERWAKGDTLLITKAQLDYLPSTNVLAIQGYMGYWWEVVDEDADI